MVLLDESITTLSSSEQRAYRELVSQIQQADMPKRNQTEFHLDHSEVHGSHIYVECEVLNSAHSADHIFEDWWRHRTQDHPTSTPFGAIPPLCDL